MDKLAVVLRDLSGRGRASPRVNLASQLWLVMFKRRAMIGDHLKLQWLLTGGFLFKLSLCETLLAYENLTTDEAQSCGGS